MADDSRVRPRGGRVGALHHALHGRGGRARGQGDDPDGGEARVRREPALPQDRLREGDRLLVELEEEEEEEESAREDERGIEDGSGKREDASDEGHYLSAASSPAASRGQQLPPRVANVLEAVRRRVPGASAERSSALASAASATSASFALPRDRRAAFPAALRALEGAEGKALGVASVGVACSTLEEVFHDVGARVAKLLDEGREGDAEGTTRKGRGGREKTVETEETSPEETSPEETSPEETSPSSSSSKKPASALRRDPPRGPSATPARRARLVRRSARGASRSSPRVCSSARRTRVATRAAFASRRSSPFSSSSPARWPRASPRRARGIRPSRRWTRAFREAPRSASPRAPTTPPPPSTAAASRPPGRAPNRRPWSIGATRTRTPGGRRRAPRATRSRGRSTPPFSPGPSRGRPVRRGRYFPRRRRNGLRIRRRARARARRSRKKPPAAPGNRVTERRAGRRTSSSRRRRRTTRSPRR